MTPVTQQGEARANRNGRASSGNEKGGFDEFFRAHYSPVVGFLLKYGFRRTDAEEAAAEAMSQALAKWDTITNPKAWVFIVARRIASSELKRQRDGIARAARSTPMPAVSSDDAAIAIIDEFPPILSLLKRLPPQQRMAMALCLDGFGIDTIAEIMNLKRSTARSHLRHARERLKAEWEAERDD